MNIILLPGISVRNRDWAIEVKDQLAPDIAVEYFSWPHWEGGEPQLGWIDAEAEKLISRGDSLPVLAKSIGTLVAVAALSKKKATIDKLLLCGIPLNGLDDDDKRKYKILAEIDPKKVLVLQNKEDNVGSYEDVKTFVKAIAPEIEVRETDRNDHHYPFPDLFKSFFLGH